MVSAKVRSEDGAEFVAEIANLTTNSVFFKTDQPLRDRSSIRFELFGTGLEGEVFFVSPVGVGVMFFADDQARGLIENAIPSVPSFDPATAPITGPPTDDIPIDVPIDLEESTETPIQSPITLAAPPPAMPAAALPAIVPVAPLGTLAPVLPVVPVAPGGPPPMAAAPPAIAMALPGPQDDLPLDLPIELPLDALQKLPTDPPPPLDASVLILEPLDGESSTEARTELTEPALPSGPQRRLTPAELAASPFAPERVKNARVRPPSRIGSSVGSGGVLASAVTIGSGATPPVHHLGPIGATLVTPSEVTPMALPMETTRPAIARDPTPLSVAALASDLSETPTPVLPIPLPVMPSPVPPSPPSPPAHAPPPSPFPQAPLAPAAKSALPPAKGVVQRSNLPPSGAARPGVSGLPAAQPRATVDRPRPAGLPSPIATSPLPPATPATPPAPASPAPIVAPAPIVTPIAAPPPPVAAPPPPVAAPSPTAPKHPATRDATPISHTPPAGMFVEQKAKPRFSSSVLRGMSEDLAPPSPQKGALESTAALPDEDFLLTPAELSTDHGAEPLVLSRLPGVEADGRMITESPLDAVSTALRLLIDRPLLVKGPSDLSSAKLVVGGTNIPLEAVSAGAGLLALAAESRHAVELLGAVVRDGLPLIEAALDEVQRLPDPKSVPHLEADGFTVRFDSFSQFVVQHRVNLVHGALVVAANGIPAGTQRSLRLEIPGLQEIITVSTRVAFQGEGTIGMMIDNFGTQKAALDELANRRPPRPTVAVSRTAERPTLAFQTTLVGGQGLAELFDLAHHRARTPQDARGWLLALLDHLFEARIHGICSLSEGERKLSLWLHDGCVVFTRSEPEEHLLGTRLLQEKKITRAALDAALERAQEQAQPLGSVLVEMGAIAPQVLDSSLRHQTGERVLAARDWVGGRVMVGAWVDPEIRISLVVTNGRGLVASLMRGELERVPVAELERFLEPYLDRAFTCDLARIDPHFAIRGKEKAVLAQLVPTRSLRDVYALSELPRIEVARLLILAHGLGVVEVGPRVVREKATDKNAEAIRELSGRIKRLERANPFQALDLHWTCLEEQIDESLQSEFGELKLFLGMSDPKVRDLVERAALLTKQIGRRLSDSSQRSEHRKELASGPERSRVAEQMLEQVELLIQQDDLERAQAVLTCAQEIHASERGELLQSQLEPSTD